MFLSTDLGAAIAEFLYSHRSFLGCKVFGSVTVLSLEPPGQLQKPTLIWKVIDYSPQANAQREYLQAAPYQEGKSGPGPLGNVA